MSAFSFPVSMSVGVEEVVCMPPRAMGFYCVRVDAPSEVFSACYGFKVIGIYATRLSAEMVKVETCGDGANNAFIR